MKIYLGPVLVAIAVSCAPPSFADEATDIAAFEEAYENYQTLSELRDAARSLKHAERALELGEMLFGDSHANTAALTYNYGVNLLDVRKEEEAKVILKDAIRRFELVYGVEAPEMIPVYMDLGHASAIVFRSREQKKYYKKALSIVKKVDGRRSLRYARVSLESGIGLMDKAQVVDSGSFLKESYEIYRELLGRDHASTGFAAFYAGKYELSRKRYSKANDYLEATLRTFENPDEPSNQLQLMTHAFLVEVKEELGLSGEATQHCLAIGRMSPIDPDQEYRPLFRRSPSYPSSAAERGVEGYVDFAFSIDEQGFVRDPRVIEATSYLFERPATEALMSFRYAPRFADGEPVLTENVAVRLTFQFSD